MLMQEKEFKMYFCGNQHYATNTIDVQKLSL